MAPVPILHARVSEDGKTFTFVQEERMRRQGYIKTLAGQLCDVTIRKHRVKRSLRQNSYVHLVATLLAEELGNGLDEMKLLLMREKWGWTYNDYFRREVPIKPHTSSMSVEECSQFIEWLPMWAMTELGINVPLPGEAEK